jgi:hypothetical protein
LTILLGKISHSFTVYSWNCNNQNFQTQLQNNPGFDAPQVYANCRKNLEKNQIVSTTEQERLLGHTSISLAEMQLAKLIQPSAAKFLSLSLILTSSVGPGSEV